MSSPASPQGLAQRLPSICCSPEGADGAGPAALRTLSLAKDEFAELERAAGAGTKPSLWRVSLSVRAGGADAPRYRSVSGQEEHTAGGGARSPEVAVQLGSLPTPPRPPPRPDPPRSALGLPIRSCRARGYLRWALFVLLLDLTYSAFLVPLSIAFGVNDLDWTWACFVDLAAGATFAAELFLGFHTSYCATSAGQQREVTGGRAVARYYLRHGSFWQDAVSVAIWLTQIVLLLVYKAGGVPVPASTSAFQYVRIVRLVRFAAVVRQLFVLTVGSGAGAIVPGLRVPPRLAHALNVAYSGLVLVHFFACLWNFIAAKEGFEGTWLNTIAAFQRRYSPDGASPLTAAELEGVPPGDRYVAGLYFTVVTVATLGYGDVVPVNTLEYLVDCLVIAVGVLMFGLAMGSLAEVVASSSKEARQAQLFREKMEGVNDWLHASGIRRPLRRRIREYYQTVWLRQVAARANAAERFQELPHALRGEVAWDVNRALLQRLPLFRELDEAQRFALSGQLLPADLTPGMELCLPGDPADAFWLLHEGEVQLFDDTEVVHTVSAPAVLGVEALLQHVDAGAALRPYGFRAVTACTLWEASMDDLLPWLLDNTATLDALAARAQRQREALEDAIARDRWAAACGSATPSAAAAAPASSKAGMAGGDAVAAAAAAAPGTADMGGAESGAGGGGAVTTTWTISSSGPSLEPSASQPLEGGGHPPAASASAAAGAPGPLGDPPADADAPATMLELWRVHCQLAQRLDGMAADLRRTAAAATLAHTLGAAGGGRRRSSPGGHADAGGRGRRRHWSYGQLTTL